MNCKALFKAALSIAAVAASFVIEAAPIAPACMASLNNPSWADCADDVPHAASGDMANAWVIHAAGARAGSADFTALSAGADGANRDRSPARAYPLQVVPSIPEPHTMVLMLAGLVAIGFMAMRRRDR
jgi:PEP-CTERM motif